MPDPSASQDLDRFQAAVSTVVDSLFGDRMRALGFEPCKVTEQNGMTVNLQPDNPNLSPPNEVPVLGMTPQTTFTVQPGARCFLFFAGGDRTKPRAALFDTSTFTKLVFGDPNNAPAAARKGDTVDCGELVLLAVGPVSGVTTYTLQWVPPGGGAPQQIGIWAAPGTGTAGTQAITGKINSGSAKLFIE